MPNLGVPKLTGVCYTSVNIKNTNIFKLSVTNCYLIKCLGGYLLIDTAYTKYYYKFIRELGKRNIDVSEIKYLLLTHHHDDHAGFAAKLKLRTNCKIIVHEKAIDWLKIGKTKIPKTMLNIRVFMTISLFKLFHNHFEYPPVIIDENDIIISGDDDDTLRQIGIMGKIIYTPGHSDDSISVILDDRSAFVGDAAMNFLNFCGIKYRPIFIENLGSVFDSWQKIIDNGTKIIYPAHGKPFTIDKLLHCKNIL